MIEVVLMDRFHWTWRDLQETPAEVVEDALDYLTAEARASRDAERELKRGRK